MTTIFAFKAKNAWVLVADRFATNNLNIEDGKIERPYQTLLADVDDKIIIHKEELVFSGCGDQERITDLAEELSKNCSSFCECKDYIAKQDNDNKFEGFKKILPKLLIFFKKEEKGILINFEERDILKKIVEVEHFIILGGGERSINKAIVQQDISETINKDISKEDAKHMAVRCAKLLDKIWLGLHKDDLKLTGPPCFIGCTVCIIWKDKIDRIMVSPKDYETV